MKRKFTHLLVLLSFFMAGESFAQEKCLTEILFQEAAAKDPSLLIKREEMEKATAEFIAKSSTRKTSAATRVVPVVFHIIYEDLCGPENISDAQIFDQMRTLNLDFQRLNEDTTDTPGPHKAKSADCNLEFRLANIDPNGNCTNGIVRVFSRLTNNARNNVKSLSYWDSKKYLNIWVVKTIETSPGTPPGSFVAGFAQFPNSGSAATDGVVLRHDYTGSIGTATTPAGGSNGLGRTATHEVGHWLNLRHIWGDQNCGSDQVGDTPTHTTSNNGCPNFPKLNSCASGSDPVNGEMFTNYMDYTDGRCQNMFSLGQKARMDAVLDPSTGFRKLLTSQSNLLATGTDDSHIPTVCIPKADFCNNRSLVCEGTTINFTDRTWKATPTSWKWLLPGAATPVSTSQNPVATYTTPGIYDVTLIAFDSAGSDTLVRPGLINVLANSGQAVAPIIESFEAAALSDINWTALDDKTDNVFWSITNTAAVTGTSSAKLNNYNATSTGNKHSLVSEPVNFGPVPGKLTFKTSYAKRSNTTSDVLKVFYSITCGSSWLNISGATFTGTNLASGVIPSSFTPASPNLWEEQTLTLPSNLANKNGILFRFEFTNGGGGNNLYLEDINIGGASVVGIEEAFSASSVELFPNPSGGKVSLALELNRSSKVTVKIYDIIGKEVLTIADNTEMSAGNHQLDASLYTKGVYFVKTTAGNHTVVSKLVIN
jgi:PKD repeat protein